MLDKILPFLNHLIPPYLAMKGLGKIDPRLGKFFTGAIGTGYSVDQAIGFLRDRLKPEGFRGEEERLEQGAQRGTLRPDELAARQDIRNRQLPANVAQKGAALATGGIGGALAALGKGEESVQKMGLPTTQPAEEQKPLSEREQAMKKYNRMRKQKSLIDQLQEDFEKEHGPGLREAQAPANSMVYYDTPIGTQKQNISSPQLRNNFSNDDQLIAAMQQILKM